MPIFFFDSYDGEDMVRDNEGQELADITAVRREAFEDVRELVAAVVARGEVIESRELLVRDASGQTVLTLPFRDVLNGEVLRADGQERHRYRRHLGTKASSAANTLADTATEGMVTAPATDAGRYVSLDGMLAAFGRPPLAAPGEPAPARGPTLAALVEASKRLARFPSSKGAIKGVIDAATAHGAVALTQAAKQGEP